MTSKQAPPPRLDDARRQAFRLAHDFRARWQGTIATLPQWEQATSDMAQISAENGSDLFLMDLLLACFTDIERTNGGEERSVFRRPL